MKIRVVLDTNLWISYLISNQLSKLDELIEKDALVVLFSTELLEEFIEVAGRPKFRKYFSIADLEELLDLFDAYGEIVDVSSISESCRDPKDNFLLALAQDGRADYLLTGDADLLELRSYGAAQIIKYSDFETRILDR